MKLIAMAKAKKTNVPTSLPSFNRLVALPVAGDAFLMIRDNESVLIDGGKSGAKLYKSLLTELPSVIKLDKIICTHNDADHAEGLAQLLEDPVNFPLKVQQVWLPGSWADTAAKVVDGQVTVLMDLLYVSHRIAERGDWKLYTPRIFTQSRVSEWIEITRRYKALGLDAARWFGKDKSTPENKGAEKPDKEGLSTSMLLSKLARCDIKEITRQVHSKRRYALTRFTYKREISKAKSWAHKKKRTKAVLSSSGKQYQLLVKTLECIYRIAIAAANRGAIIRWFDAEEYYNKKPSRAVGGEKNLVPLNSVELSFITPPALPPTYLLFLTQQNLQSLIFYAPQSTTWPGCVFSADGLLDGDDLSPFPARPIVITAPHHGSDSNKKAYAEITRMLGGKNWQQNSILLRSDVNTSKNPCAAYKSTKLRLCTVCANAKYKCQKTTIAPKGMPLNWNFTAAKTVRPCDCL
jgi:hypothetical protein